MPGFSAAGRALGFTGNSVADQVPNESPEARKKRLAALQAAQLGIGRNISSGYSAALSPAGMALFGGSQ
jgi:hypothetical protein